MPKRYTTMERAGLISAAFVVFSHTAYDGWKQAFFQVLLEHGYSQDDLEEMADFCEQLGPVISEVHSTQAQLDIDP